MEQHTEVFVGLDVAKVRHAVAIAESGRDGEVRFFGEINADAESVRRMVAKLAKRHAALHFCYEACENASNRDPSPEQAHAIEYKSEFRSSEGSGFARNVTPLHPMVTE